MRTSASDSSPEPEAEVPSLGRPVTCRTGAGPRGLAAARGLDCACCAAAVRGLEFQFYFICLFVHVYMSILIYAL